MKKPIIAVIVAMDEHNAIGKSKGMLWRLPDDFKHFKRTTLGHPVIMGRKTFESLGGALKGRLNIVITRQQDYHPEGATVVSNLDEAIRIARADESEEIFIGGGGEIYRQAMALVDKLYLTIVHHTFDDADTFFPEIDYENWKETYHEYHAADERHKYAFTFVFLERKEMKF